MKYLFLIFILTNTAFCDFSLTAKEAMDRTNEISEIQKTRCVNNWKQEIEDGIDSTIIRGECSYLFYVPKCVSNSSLQNILKKLKSLGYVINKNDDENLPPSDRNYNISWCRE